MDIATVKYLVENHLQIDLEEAQEAIVEGKIPDIEIAGRSDSERLSQIIAAIWVVREMNQEQIDFVTAFEAYSESLR